MGADGIEVAQSYYLESEGAHRVAQNFFAHLLGVAVGRLGGLNGRGFGNRQRIRLTVDGAGGAKNESARRLGALVVQQVEQRVEVVAVVGNGFGHALTHRLVGSEVNDSVKVATPQKSLGGSLVGKVDLNPLGANARNGLDAVEYLSSGIVQVVSQNNSVAAGDEVHGGVRADVAKAPGDENGFHLLKALKSRCSCL